MENLYLDSEFTGLHQNTTIISIGIVSDSGKTFYAELNYYDKSQVDEWLQKNVIDNLIMSEPPEGEDEYYTAIRHTDNEVGNDLYKSYSVQLRCNMSGLKVELGKWLSQFDKVEMWGDCLSYDWVIFCQIFGHAFNIPKNIQYTPFDIVTLFKYRRIDPDINREVFTADALSENGEPLFFDKNVNIIEGKKHNALWDAHIIKRCFHKLMLK